MLLALPRVLVGLRRFPRCRRRPPLSRPVTPARRPRPPRWKDGCWVPTTLPSPRRSWPPPRSSGFSPGARPLPDSRGRERPRPAPRSGFTGPPHAGRAGDNQRADSLPLRRTHHHRHHPRQGDRRAHCRGPGLDRHRRHSASRRGRVRRARPLQDSGRHDPERSPRFPEGGEGRLSARNGEFRPQDCICPSDTRHPGNGVRSPDAAHGHRFRKGAPPGRGTGGRSEGLALENAYQQSVDLIVFASSRGKGHHHKRRPVLRAGAAQQNRAPAGQRRRMAKGLFGCARLGRPPVRMAPSCFPVFLSSENLPPRPGLGRKAPAKLPPPGSASAARAERPRGVGGRGAALRKGISSRRSARRANPDGN